MKKIFWAGLAVLLAGGAFVAATAIDAKKEAPAPKAPTLAERTSPRIDDKQEVLSAPTVPPVVYGKEKAPVTITEFASFTCSHCADFHKEILPEVTEKLLDTGKAQLHLNSFIRNEQDLRATMLVYCVEGNEKRQQFVKAILQAQEQWAFTADFLENLRVMAQVGGVSHEQFDACMADKAMEDKLILNRNYALGKKIESTPYFVIGEESILGARDADEFEKAVNSATPKK
jgi:protein-disulfide isomerase